MTPSKLRWGLLFITAGVLLLLNNAGYLSWDYWLDLLSWWPLILIAIGLEKIFVKSKLQFISYLAPLILIVPMVYLAVDTGPDRWERSFGDRYNWKTEMDKSVEKVDAVIDHDRSDLRVNRSSFNLATAKFDRFSRKPDIEFTKKNEIAELKLESSGGRRSPIIISGRGSYHDWRVSFSDEVPLQLKCLGYQSDVDLNLESIPVEKLVVNNDDGNIYMKLGIKMALVEVSVTGDGSYLRIRVPEGCGLKITGGDYAASLEALKLVDEEKIMISEGFDEADIRIIFDLGEGLESLSLTYY